MKSEFGRVIFAVCSPLDTNAKNSAISTRERTEIFASRIRVLESSIPGMAHPSSLFRNPVSRFYRFLLESHRCPAGRLKHGRCALLRERGSSRGNRVEEEEL